jgi:hypothetical protein
VTAIFICFHRSLIFELRRILKRFIGYLYIVVTWCLSKKPNLYVVVTCGGSVNKTPTVTNLIYHATREFLCDQSTAGNGKYILIKTGRLSAHKYILIVAYINPKSITGLTKPVVDASLSVAEGSRVL